MQQKNGNAKAINQAGENMIPKAKMAASGCTFADSSRNKKRKQAC